MLKMLKFKEGTVVRITDNTCSHGFEIGELTVIEKIIDWENGMFSYDAHDHNGHSWVFDDDDCELVKGVLQ